MQLNNAGVWKNASPHVNGGGVWKPAQEVWVKDAGVWKKEWENVLTIGTATITVGYSVGSITKGYVADTYGALSPRIFTLPSGKQFGVWQLLATNNASALMLENTSGTWTSAEGAAIIEELNMHLKTVVLNGVKYNVGFFTFDTKLGTAKASPGYPFTIFDGKAGEQWPVAFTNEVL